jgi:hypothetical protein
MLITELNTSTGELVEREMTQEEKNNYANAVARAKASQLEAESKELARQTALDKLAALGLTPEEISAITGA